MNTIGSAEPRHFDGAAGEYPGQKQIDEFIRRWDKFPVAPERRANPWAQNTVDGEEINLFDILPLFRLNDGDGGFISTKRALSRAIRSTRTISASRTSVFIAWK